MKSVLYIWSFCVVWHYVCRNGSTTKKLHCIQFVLSCFVRFPPAIKPTLFNIPTSDQAQQSDQISQMCLLYSCLSLFLFIIKEGNIPRQRKHWAMGPPCLLCATGWLRKLRVGLRVRPVGEGSACLRQMGSEKLHYWMLAQEILNKCKANCFWQNYSRPFCYL